MQPPPKGIYPEGIWLGASYNPSTGKFVWESSKTSLTYAKWSKGQPSNPDTYSNPVAENYVHMWDSTINPNGQWNDIHLDGWRQQTTLCEVLFSC